jgi:hypothetical protein
VLKLVFNKILILICLFPQVLSKNSSYMFVDQRKLFIIIIHQVLSHVTLNVFDGYVVCTDSKELS